MLIYKIEDQLHTAKTFINGAIENPEILDELAKYNYDKQQLFRAKDLLDKVLEYQKLENQEFSNVSLLSLKEDRKLAHRTFVRHLAIAREALPKRVGNEYDPIPAFQKKGNEASWLEQAVLFYNNIMYSASELMNFGIEKSELEQAKAMVEAVRDASIKSIKSQDELRKLTKKRDKAFNELMQWMFKFKAIAQLVLEDDPDKLANLGFELES